MKRISKQDKSTIKGEISNYDVKFVTAKKPTKVLAQSLKPILFQLEISSISRLRIPQQAKEKSIRKQQKLKNLAEQANTQLQITTLQNQINSQKY